MLFISGAQKKAGVFNSWGFPGGSVVKNLPANAGDVSSIPGLGRSPGKGNGNHSSIFAGIIPWTEELRKLQYMGLQRIRHDLVTQQQQISKPCSFALSVQGVVKSQTRLRD